MVFTRSYTSNQLPFHRAEALRYFGYPQSAIPTPTVRSLFDECVEEGISACSYQVCYTELDVKINSPCDMDLGFIKANSRALFTNLKGCEKVIAFAATVGLGVDRLLARYGAISADKAYAVQAIGAERIETLCNVFNREMAEKYRQKGYYARPRFSCGYGDFSIEHQRAFISYLDCERKIGLTVNDSLLLSPSKSVTALIGLGKSPVKNQTESCENCNQKSCEYQRQNEENLNDEKDRS